MTTSALIPIPSDETSFEDKCVILARDEFKDPNASTFAEKGYKQYGIDILAYRDQDPKKIIGIQCKLKTKGSAPTESEIRRELKKLRAFEHELEGYYIWHTTNDSIDLEKLAITLTRELADSGKKTTVHIWGWRKLSNLISQNIDALRAFSPDHTAAIDQILQRMADRSSSDEEMQSTIKGISESINRIEQTFEAPDASLGGEELGTFHAVIDQYADLLRNGQAQTALNLLCDLENTFNSQTPGIVKFRVRANIGYALTRLGRIEEGSKALKEAVQFGPNSAKSWQTRAIAEGNLDNFEKAYQILNEGLSEFPDDPDLISLLLSFGSRGSQLEDPWTVVPNHLTDNESVLFGVVDFLRARNDRNWRETAKAASKQFPDSKMLCLAASEAILEEATEKYGGQQIIPQDDELTHAAEYLQQIHDSAHASEEKAFKNNLIVGCNLVTAYRLLCKYEAAGKVADELLPYADDLPAIIDSTIPVLAALSRYDECKDLLQRMPLGRDRVMLMIETYLALGEYTDLIEGINQAALDVLSPDDKVRAESALLIAHDAHDPNSVTLDDIDSLAASEPITVDTLSIAARLYARKGEKDKAADTFDDALSRINEDSARPDRYNLARTAQDLGRWAEVIDLLNGYVGVDTQTEELYRLANAFVQVPKHPSAEGFFDYALNAQPDAPKLLRHASHQAFNQGDLDRAEEFSKRLIDQDSQDADAYIVCISVIDRRDKASEIAEFIKEIDLSSLKGQMRTKLRMAAICVRYGRAEDGFQFAYELTLQNLNDLTVTHFFATLALVMEQQLNQVTVNPERAQVESWVEFREADGEQGMLLTNGGSQLAHDIVNIEEDRAKALLNSAPGDTVDFPIARKRSIQVEVTGIYHPYLGLVRSILRHFERRYAGSSGSLYSIQTKEGDIKPILDEIKELAEADFETSKIYTDGVVPLFVVAPRVRGNVIDFAGYIAATDRDVISCIGTLEERNAAFQQIREAAGGGVVLDTYTYWIACEIGVLDAISDLFGQIYLAQSSVDDMVSYREQHRLRDDQPLMTIAYHDGQYYREEIPAERLKEHAELISRRIERAQNECKVVAATQPEGLATDGFQFLDHKGGHGLDSIYVAISKSALLLSDDMRYRQLAQQVGVTKFTWLQPLLMCLLDENQITSDEYHRAIVLLAARRHRYVSVRSNDLLGAAQNTYPTEEFHALARLIGFPDAEIRSHIKVVAEFTIGLDNIDQPRWARMRHFGVLIEELIKHRKEDWHEVLDALKVVLYISRQRQFSDYIDGWIRGHFLG